MRFAIAEKPLLGASLQLVPNGDNAPPDAKAFVIGWRFFLFIMFIVLLIICFLFSN